MEARRVHAADRKSRGWGLGVRDRCSVDSHRNHRTQPCEVEIILNKFLADLSKIFVSHHTAIAVNPGFLLLHVFFLFVLFVLFGVVFLFLGSRPIRLRV